MRILASVRVSSSCNSAVARIRNPFCACFLFLKAQLCCLLGRSVTGLHGLQAPPKAPGVNCQRYNNEQPEQQIQLPVIKNFHYIIPLVCKKASPAATVSMDNKLLVSTMLAASPT